jgi:hypothetical protein
MLKLNKIVIELLEESRSKRAKFIIMETDEGYDIFLEDNTYLYVDKSNPDKASISQLKQLWGRQCTPLGKSLR